jgi:NAD-dependent SIR2 family protein deacetylase
MSLTMQVKSVTIYVSQNFHCRVSGELVETCDLCLVIGTSSVVYPAAMFAPTVAERGKPVAEFNLSEDPFDEEFR